MAVSSTHELGNGDFNSFPNGLYFVAGNSFSNSPIDATGDVRGFVRTESFANGSYKTQEFVSCNGLGNAQGAHFSRACYNSVWTSWQRIDNYGTTSLSELASLLGGVSYFALYDNGSFDSAKTTGVYLISNCSTGNPSPMRYGIMLCAYKKNIGMQIYLPNSADNNIYIRTSFTGGWQNWVKVAINDVG